MSFRFQHFMDVFLEHLGPDRTLAPADFDRYFGNMLSKNLRRKLQDRPVSLEVWSPKAWSLALETRLSKESGDKLDALLEETRRLATEGNPELFRPVSKGSGHLSWNFFGDCPEPLLSKLSTAMKDMERRPSRLLESFRNIPLEFQGLDYFFKKNNHESVAYLKLKSESQEAFREIENELQSLLKFSRKGSFIPHVTIGRIQDHGMFQQSWKPKLETLWNAETFSLCPNHFTLYRHLDQLSRQGVFGLVWQ